jgi:hypothetical protein
MMVNILWPFGNVVIIWYIFPRFCILCQEKSGNPASVIFKKTAPKETLSQPAKIRPTWSPWPRGTKYVGSKAVFCH